VPRKDDKLSMEIGAVIEQNGYRKMSKSKLHFEEEKYRTV